MDLSTIELFLFDIDGVFLTGKEQTRLLSGRRVLPALRERGLPFYLVTNTSTDPPGYLCDELARHGVDVAPEQIHSAFSAAVRMVTRRFASGRCLVLGEPPLSQALEAAGLEVVQDAPADVVLMGLSRQIGYQNLSAAARCLRGGAALLACHANRVWLDDDRLALSCGAWLAALEYATGVKPEIFGKPTATFYRQVLEMAGVEPSRTLMVGDDLEADVGGAQGAGLAGALVLSGKTTRADLDGQPEDGRVQPDLVLDEIDDLVKLLPG